MDGILNFFTREAGRGRRSALDEFSQNIGYFIPPELRGILGVAADMTPTATLERAGQASQRMFDPSRSGMERVGDFGSMLSETAAIAAPAAVAGRAAMPASQALQEGLLGFSSGAGSVGEVAANTYRMGQMLQPPSGFAAPPGRPSNVRMPDGQQFEARPINEIEQAAFDYLKSTGMDTAPMTQYPPFSEERAGLIAAAYDMMQHDPNSPAVRRAYDAMIQETLDQYNALRNRGIDFRFLREGMDDPYAASPALGYRDLVENGRLFVFPTDFGFGTGSSFDPSTNPLLTRVGRIGDKDDAVANDAFRAVHDAFGHFGPGNPFFRHQGEERAFLEHARMYSPEARGAMTSETRGQNSWLNFGPFGQQNRSALGADTVFADQKTGLLPSWATQPTGMPDPDEERMLRGLLNQWTGR